MQTADQINGPQAGSSKFTPNPTPPGKMPQTVRPAAPVQPPPTPEVWSVRNLRLPSDQAIAKIKADDKIPTEDKDWIVRKIEKSGHAGVIVDAHEHFSDGDTHCHASVVKLY